MLEVVLLGTGGTVPLPNRWLTSLLCRWNGHEMLIDCGEGTQIALNAHGYSCRHIDTILLTHLHADHTAGLPGILLSMAKADRTEPVTIIGPKDLQQVLEGVHMIARYVPFDIRFMVLEEKEQSFDIEDLKVTAFSVRHGVPCYGYELQILRKPKFDVVKAKENYVPLKAWSRLQKGETVELDGITYTPDLVRGEERKGIKLVYCTDTRPCMALEEHAKEADLLITEGMYGDREKEDKAKMNRHMMMQEAASLAYRANVKELWLTHYSPSMHVPEDYEEEISDLFEHSVISKDGQHKDIAFGNEEE